MYRDRNILAVVPARGGSKGIKLKNLLKINGRTLIEIVSNVINDCEIFTRAVVSTDHQKIALEAKRVGLEVPFMRPESISGDRIGDHDVLRHALLASEKHYGTNFDIVVMLQPTSPLRTSAEVKKAIDALIDNERDAVWTLSETDLKYHPHKAITADEDGKIGFFSEYGNSIIARQQLSSIYHRNGVAYAMKRQILTDGNKIMSQNTGCVVLDREHVSIDTLADLKKVTELL